MELEQAVVDYLTADPVLTGLAGGRIYPDQAPSTATRPYVIYSQPGRRRSRVLAAHNHHLTPGTVNLPSLSMRLDVYATTAPSRRAVMRAISERLEGFQGYMDGAVLVSGVFHEDDDAGSEVPAQGAELGDYTAGIDLTFHYSEVM